MIAYCLGPGFGHLILTEGSLLLILAVAVITEITIIVVVTVVGPLSVSSSKPHQLY